MIVVNDVCGDEDIEYLFREYLKAYIFSTGPLAYNTKGLHVVENRLRNYLESHCPRSPEFTADYDSETRTINISFGVI